MSERSQLHLTHTSAEGTTLTGTDRGDGSGPVIKTLGWRWSRPLGAWYLPRTRDQVPRRDVIADTAQTLDLVGFDVVVQIDSAPRAAADSEAAQSDNAQHLAEHHAQRAERLQVASDQSYEKYATWKKGQPLGQPLLSDHHSAGPADNRHRRAHAAFDQSVQQEREAKDHLRLETEARAHTGARYNSVTVVNRVDRLRSTVNKLQQIAPAERAPEHEDRLAHAQMQLEYWQQIRSQQLADGTAPSYGPDTVTAGDFISLNHKQWWLVLRANKATVTVETTQGRGKVPWRSVFGHQTAKQRRADDT